MIKQWEVCACAVYEVKVLSLARKRRVGGKRYEDVAQQAPNEAQHTVKYSSCRC